MSIVSLPVLPFIVMVEKLRLVDVKLPNTAMVSPPLGVWTPYAVYNRMHVKHLHATVLNQMGLDPNKLTYFFSGLDQKLVGVEGADPIAKII